MFSDLRQPECFVEDVPVAGSGAPPEDAIVAAEEDIQAPIGMAPETTTAAPPLHVHVPEQAGNLAVTEVVSADDDPDSVTPPQANASDKQRSETTGQAAKPTEQTSPPETQTGNAGGGQAPPDVPRHDGDFASEPNEGPHNEPAPDESPLEDDTERDALKELSIAEAEKLEDTGTRMSRAERRAHEHELLRRYREDKDEAAAAELVRHYQKSFERAAATIAAREGSPVPEEDLVQVGLEHFVKLWDTHTEDSGRGLGRHAFPSSYRHMIIAARTDAGPVHTPSESTLLMDRLQTLQARHREHGCPPPTTAEIAEALDIPIKRRQSNITADEIKVSTELVRNALSLEPLFDELERAEDAGAPPTRFVSLTGIPEPDIEDAEDRLFARRDLIENGLRAYIGEDSSDSVLHQQYLRRAGNAAFLAERIGLVGGEPVPAVEIAKREGLTSANVRVRTKECADWLRTRIRNQLEQQQETSWGQTQLVRGRNAAMAQLREDRLQEARLRSERLANHAAQARVVSSQAETGQAGPEGRDSYPAPPEVFQPPADIEPYREQIATDIGLVQQWKNGITHGRTELRNRLVPLASSLATQVEQTLSSNPTHAEVVQTSLSKLFGTQTTSHALTHAELTQAGMSNLFGVVQEWAESPNEPLHTRVGRTMWQSMHAAIEKDYADTALATPVTPDMLHHLRTVNRKEQAHIIAGRPPLGRKEVAELTGLPIARDPLKPTIVTSEDVQRTFHFIRSLPPRAREAKMSGLAQESTTPHFDEATPAAARQLFRAYIKTGANDEQRLRNAIDVAYLATWMGLDGQALTPQQISAKAGVTPTTVLRRLNVVLKGIQSLVG
jgi:hypothetical protein